MSERFHTEFRTTVQLPECEEHWAGYVASVTAQIGGWEIEMTRK